MTELRTERGRLPSDLTRRALATAVGIQLLVRGFGIISGVVVAAALARGLNHDDFGRLALVFSLVAMVMVVGEFGITSTAVRHLSVHPEAEAAIAGSLVLVRSITGVAGAIAVVGAAGLADGSGQVLPIAALAAGSLLFSPLTSLQPIGQARLEVNAVNALLFLQSALWAAAVLILAAQHAPVRVFAASFLGVSAVYAVVNWLVFRPKVDVTFVGAFKQAGFILSAAWPVIVGGFFVTAYYRLDGMILFYYHGPDRAADFAAAYRFLDVLQVIPGTLLFAALPLLSSTWRSKDPSTLQRRRRLFDLSLKATICIALPISVVGALISDRLVSAIYGSGFGEAGYLLRILIAGFPAIAVGYIAVGLALACDRARLYAAVAVVAAVFNIGANLFLIPRYAAEAAAWTTLGTEYVVSAVLLGFLTTSAGVAIPWGSWSRISAACICSGAVVFPIRHESMLLSLPAGAVSFLIAGTIFRVLARSDFRALTSRERLETL